MQHAASDPSVGGKAGALARLDSAGFDVPPFFTIVGTPDPSALASALAALGAGPYAVRSSGLQEDGAAHSHAGQFESILNVGPADVPAAVERVAASGERDGIAAYRAGHGLEGGGRPAVIVQAMIDAEFAGVAFSADPVTGRRDRIVISATAGLGDRLVAGEIDGSTWWIDTTSERVADASGDDALLSPAQLQAVAALVRQVEAAFGGPQDIEWAYAGDRLHLLQARPITSPIREAPIADDGIAVFDNSNIVESYPGIVSPLTFTFAAYAYARVYTAFVGLLGVSSAAIGANRNVFENMLVRVNGRVYYNLGNWYRALALLPGYALNRGFMETMMGVGAPLPAEMAARLEVAPATGWAKTREYGRLAKVAFGLLREAVGLPARARDFRLRLDRALAATTPERLKAMPLTELAAEYRRIESDLLDRWDAPIVNDFLCMIAFGASRRLLETWLAEDGLQIHNDVLIGQGDIISARPAQLIRAMGARAADDPGLIAALEADDRAALAASAIAPDIAAYVAEFGDRCTEELKLESVTLDEDPRSLHAAIAAAARSRAAPPVRNSDPFARLHAGLRGRPLRRMVAGALLRWTKNRVRDRENLRYERTRIFGRARRLLLAVGRQFHAAGLVEDPRDVFLLTIQEVLGTIEGFAVSFDLAGLAALRRGEMERAAASPDPGERLIVRGGAYTALTALSAARSEEEGTERKGTGCSAGRATAVARVIADPRGQSIAAGEILVARHTDPGWIALFASASAIVVERGSLLSHSAIVARELGIPCVVGLKGATDWIRDGETIEVDGASGLVRRCAP
ncbi:PEP/pyruvate-binding domain-containing protein [Allosphingosinicella deserti]|nr:PEP/pyruvate-binding domain-containing protein [Sphingomonas deserti]